MGRTIAAAGLTIALSTLTVVSAKADLAISSKPTENVSCSAGVCSATAKKAVLNVDALTAMLGSGDVTVSTGGIAKNIDVTAALSWASTSRLTLDADKSLVVKQPVTVAGSGALTISTNGGHRAVDLEFFGKGSVQFWDLSSSLVINGKSYTLVGDIATLASDVAGNPSGHFALANNYDASVDGTYPNSPMPVVFSGTFEGLGNRIADVTIETPNKDEYGPSLGFFAAIGANGVVENLSLVGAKVVNGGMQTTGILAANNLGSIARVHVSGRVLAGFESLTGGLVGTNSGTILSSDSAGFVQARNASMLGGLVGIQYEGQISDSHSTAKVVEITRPFSSVLATAGGLVGDLRGSLTQSWASGSVEVGKRADLVLVDGDPLANISDLRRVVKVVRNGQLYDSQALGRSVGFARTPGHAPIVPHRSLDSQHNHRHYVVTRMPRVRRYP